MSLQPLPPDDKRSEDSEQHLKKPSMDSSLSLSSIDPLPFADQAERANRSGGPQILMSQRTGHRSMVF